VKKIRLYSLAQAANPPNQSYIDLSGKLFDGVVAFDETFYERLAKMVNEEPVQARDLVAMGPASFHWYREGQGMHAR
jgi:hypothetical protein